MTWGVWLVGVLVMVWVGYSFASAPLDGRVQGLRRDTVLGQAQSSAKSVEAEAEPIDPLFIDIPELGALPTGARIIEIAEIPPDVRGHRALVLWMIDPKNVSGSSDPEEYTCPEVTRGRYLSGPTRVSLVDTRTYAIDLDGSIYGRPTGRTREVWVDHLFAVEPEIPGHWSYRLDYRGRGGGIDLYRIRYDTRYERFVGTYTCMSDEELERRGEWTQPTYCDDAGFVMQRPWFMDDDTNDQP